MEVTRLDPDDEAAVDGWYGAVAATEADLWPGEPGWQRRELVAELRQRGGAHQATGLVARHGGRVVGAGSLEVSHHDNQHLARLFIQVPPRHRRQGVGTALLGTLLDMARDRGRRVAGAFQDEPLRVGGRSPGRAFAERHGFRMVLQNARRDLALPVDQGRLAALERAAHQRATGYGTLSWTTPWPEEYLEDRLHFGRRMSTDAPTGESSSEEEFWDARRVRSLEEVLGAQGRTMVTTVARHQATGRLVAFTQIAVPGEVPEKAYQHDTLVVREHRGHRLGTLVKVANLRALAACSSPTRLVITYNAVTNHYMTDVNDALGCVVTGHLLCWEREVDAPGDRPGWPAPSRGG